MTEREIMLAGQMYNPLDEELVKMRLQARLITEQFNKTSAADEKKRKAVTKSFGSNVVIGGNPAKVISRC